MRDNKISDKEFVEKYESLPTIRKHIWNTIRSIFGSIFSIIFFGVCCALVVLLIQFVYTGIYLVRRDNYEWILIFCLIIKLGLFCYIIVPPMGKRAKKILVYSTTILLDSLSKKSKFLKECGMDKTTADNHYKFIKDKVIYMPWIQQICKMNPSAKYNQLILIKKWYEMDHSAVDDYVFDSNYKDDDFKFFITLILSKDISIRKTFVDRLFKLAIVQDGIHNDEWNFLMKTMEELNFNKNYFALFQRRYGPLRTEFDEDKNNMSTEYHSVAYLKPYYSVLGLDENASDEEVKKAYHALALEHHPDLPKNAGREKECEAMMAKINEAYEKIRN